MRWLLFWENNFGKPRNEVFRSVKGTALNGTSMSRPAPKALREHMSGGAGRSGMGVVQVKANFWKRRGHWAQALTVVTVICTRAGQSTFHRGWHSLTPPRGATVRTWLLCKGVFFSSGVAAYIISPVLLQAPPNSVSHTGKKKLWNQAFWESVEETWDSEIRATKCCLCFTPFSFPIFFTYSCPPWRKEGRLSMVPSFLFCPDSHLHPSKDKWKTVEVTCVHWTLNIWRWVWYGCKTLWVCMFI